MRWNFLQGQRSCRRHDVVLIDLDPGEGRDLGAGGDEDVLSVDDLLAAVSRYGRHLILTGHLPKTVDVGHFVLFE